MSLYEKIVSGEEKVSLVGLGYVGMPIAVALGVSSICAILPILNFEATVVTGRRGYSRESRCSHFWRFLSLSLREIL